MDHAFWDSIHLWLQQHMVWLGPALALTAFLESLTAIGILLPGVAILFTLALTAGAAGAALMPLLIWGFVGAVLGDALSFWIGYYFHDRLPRMWPFRKHPNWLEDGEKFFERFGSLSVVLGRFVGPIRPIIPTIAGMMGMTPWHFFVINITSAVVWAPVYLMPGYITGVAMQWQTTLPKGLFEAMAGFTAFSLLMPLVVLGFYHYLRWQRNAYLLLYVAMVSAVIVVYMLHFDTLHTGITAFSAATHIPWLTASIETLTWLGSWLVSGLLLVVGVVFCFHYKQGFRVLDLLSLMAGCVLVLAAYSFTVGLNETQVWLLFRTAMQSVTLLWLTVLWGRGRNIEVQWTLFATACFFILGHMLANLAVHTMVLRVLLMGVLTGSSAIFLYWYITHQRIVR